MCLYSSLFDAKCLRTHHIPLHRALASVKASMGVTDEPGADVEMAEGAEETSTLPADLLALVEKTQTR